jgi:hypothetical protein
LSPHIAPRERRDSLLIGENTSKDSCSSRQHRVLLLRLRVITSWPGAITAQPLENASARPINCPPLSSAGLPGPVELGYPFATLLSWNEFMWPLPIPTPLDHTLFLGGWDTMSSGQTQMKYPGSRILGFRRRDCEAYSITTVTSSFATSHDGTGCESAHESFRPSRTSPSNRSPRTEKSVPHRQPAHHETADRIA